MVHSKQSHRSVEQCETTRTQRRQKKYQQTKKMRTSKFHQDYNNTLVESNDIIENNIKCSERNVTNNKKVKNYEQN